MGHRRFGNYGDYMDVQVSLKPLRPKLLGGGVVRESLHILLTDYVPIV